MSYVRGLWFLLILLIYVYVLTSHVNDVEELVAMVWQSIEKVQSIDRRRSHLHVLKLVSSLKVLFKKTE